MLELGVGTGLSFPHYPAEVGQLVAVEPEPTMRARAAKAAQDVPLDVRVVEGTADALPAPDASVDAAVISQVLCSVPDQARALAELAARPASRGSAALLRARAVAQRAGRRVQRALDATVWPRTMGGCHLGRYTAAAIVAAGFELRELRRFRVGPTPAAPHILGAAIAAP